MSNGTNAPAASRGSQYATLAAALLGWMFDGFEMGLFPLIGKPALKELLGSNVSQAVADQWFGVIMAVFLVGAASGGVLFGWLGDKIGRVRAMSLSIFTYAILTGLCGFATEAWHIAVLRFIASLGMGGEWSLGVDFENHTSHPSVGDILFYPGGYSETEIIMAYGPCSFSSKLGQLAGNHFLTVVDGREQLPEIGRKVLWEGAQEVVFSLA